MKVKLLKYKLVKGRKGINKITFYPNDELMIWIKKTAMRKRKSVNKLTIFALDLYRAREESRVSRFSKVNIKKKQIKGGKR